MIASVKKSAEPSFGRNTRALPSCTRHQEQHQRDRGVPSLCWDNLCYTQELLEDLNLMYFTVLCAGRNEGKGKTSQVVP